MSRRNDIFHIVDIYKGNSNTRGTTKRKASSSELLKLPAGSPVYVYRDITQSWEGLYPFIGIYEETKVVQLPHRQKNFRSTIVRAKSGSIFETHVHFTNDDED